MESQVGKILIPCLCVLFNNFGHRLYRLRKELFCFNDDRIAVEFWYEHSSVSDLADPNIKWYRTYGIEHWVFERCLEIRWKLERKRDGLRMVWM
jgi:nuclear transport factor 2 (NTF2) superfamily protein